MTRKVERLVTQRLALALLVAAVVAAVFFVTPTPTVQAQQPYYPYPCGLGSGGRDLNGNGYDWMLSWTPGTGLFRLGDISDSLTTQWGTWGDIPTAGDFNGDGYSDIAVFRPSNGTWYVKACSLTNCTGAVTTLAWGTAGDIPVAADYNADSYVDYGVWRPSTGEWFVKSGANPATILVNGVAWGTYGDCPMPGRLSGSGAGQLELNVWRPSNGVWYYGRSLTGTGGSTYQCGTYGDIPFAVDADIDGDGDLVVWRPSNGVWYACGGPTFAIQWGTASDIPLMRSGPGGGGADTALTVWRPSTRQLFTCLAPFTSTSCGSTDVRTTNASVGDVFLIGGPK